MDVSELMAYLLTPAAQVLMIMSIAEIAKQIGLAKRYVPAFDLIVGILFGYFVYNWFLNFTMVESMLIGIALGLSACGLFSGIKNTFIDE